MKLSIVVFCVVVAQLCYTQAQYQFNEEYIRNYQNNARNLGTYIGENLDLEQLESELEADASRGRLDLLSLGLLGGLLGSSISKSSCQRTCPPLNGVCKYKLLRGYSCVPRNPTPTRVVPLRTSNIEALRFCQQNCPLPGICRRSLNGYVCQ